MHIKIYCIAGMLFFGLPASFAQQKRGADVNWITYEAEHMATNGTVLGPRYGPYRVETESSGEECVKLTGKGQYLQFTPQAAANSMVIRYSLPDAIAGNGLSSTLGIYVNGKLVSRQTITSRYTWLYGKYPFTNDPSAGVPRRFYDEVRLMGISIKKDDVIRIQRDAADSAAWCIIDLVDLENVAPPLTAPSNSLSLTDNSFLKQIVNGDYTAALRNCITQAAATGKTIFIPAGNYKITGDITLPANITIQGAGMWYTNLVGDENLYTDANRRLRIIGDGDNIHISDIALTGALNYRSDKEANDGIVGSYGTNSTISNIWIEHTKVGMWIENSKNLTITGCRMRNTMADGINFCVGMSYSTIQNCTARGTGDDCFAIWPTTFRTQLFSPGHNVISRCTGQLPYLANGAAVYGGDSNRVADCLFTDITPGSAILISTTFPTESRDKSINNNFSGTTVIERCDIKRSGGFDHEWDWRAAVEICVDKRDITCVHIDSLNIDSSLSNAIAVIAKNDADKVGILSNTILQNIHVSDYGIGVKGKHGLYVSPGAHGSLIVSGTAISGVKNESPDFMINK